MSMETNRAPAAPDASAGYERRDADVRTLLKFGFWLAVVLFAVFFASKWTFNYYAKSQQLGPPVSPFESGNVRVLPPQPRLQVTPQLDLVAYCETQREALTTYGWLDAQRSVAHIPIDVAMKKLLERGLPVRAGSPPSASGASQQGASGAKQDKSAGLEFGPCGYVLETQAAAQPGHGRD